MRIFKWKPGISDLDLDPDPVSDPSQNVQYEKIVLFFVFQAKNGLKTSSLENL